MRDGREEAGFTLIEVLVAVLALALLMTGGGLMLNSAVEGQRLVEGRTEALRELQITRAHLSSDIGNAVARRVSAGVFDADPQSLFGGRPNREGIILGLVRAGWDRFDADQPRSDLTIVEYIYRDQMLVRKVWLRPDRARRTPSFETVLLENVEDVRVDFFAGGLPANEWAYTEANGAPLLPAAIGITIVRAGGVQTHQKFLVGRI